MRKTFGHQSHVLVGQKLRLISLWDSATLHAFIVVGADTLPGCASFHGFADRVGFSLVDVSVTDCSFFGVFGISWRFGRDYRLASGLNLFRFRRVLLGRWFHRCVPLWRLNGFRRLPSLDQQFGIGLGLVVINKLIDFRSRFLGRWLGLLFKVILAVIVILEIILSILLSLFLFGRFTLSFYWLNGLWLGFSDSVWRLSRKYFLTVFWLVLVINRLLQRLLDVFFINFFVVIVLFCFLLVILLIRLWYWQCGLNLFSVCFNWLLFDFWLLCDFLLKVLLKVLLSHLLASKWLVREWVGFRCLYKGFVGLSTVAGVDCGKHGFGFLFGCWIIIVKELFFVVGGLFGFGWGFGFGLVVVKVIKIELIVPIRHVLKAFLFL